MVALLGLRKILLFNTGGKTQPGSMQDIMNTSQSGTPWVVLEIKLL